MEPEPARPDRALPRRHRPPPGGSRGAEVLITPRDRIVLAFAAEQRLVEAAQVAVLLETSPRAAARRLRALTGAGMTAAERRLADTPTWYRIRPSGLRIIDSSLPPPRPAALDAHRHDVGLGWLWLAAHRGAFGELEQIVSERRMRSHDGTAAGRGEPFGIRQLGPGPAGGERLHYPDLLLETRAGHRIALELELTSKGRARREEILAGYAGSRLEAVVYLVESDRIGQAITRSARRLGLSDMLHVQRMSFEPPPGAPAAERATARRVPAREGPRPVGHTSARRRDPVELG